VAAVAVNWGMKPEKETLINPDARSKYVAFEIENSRPVLTVKIMPIVKSFMDYMKKMGISMGNTGNRLNSSGKKDTTISCKSPTRGKVPTVSLARSGIFIISLLELVVLPLNSYFRNYGF
jgi:hypothetical protein